MKKILVVDNHPMMLRFMSNLLEKEGHHILTAEDGLSALEILRSFIPNVVFVDLVMPNIDGRKLCWMIRGMEKMKDVRLIVLSAIAAEGKIDCSSFGADGCIAKGPVNKMGENVLSVLDILEKGSAADLSEKIIGLEDAYERAITTELLSDKKHSELIFDNMEEGVIELTSEKKIIYVNSAGISIMGIPEEKLLGLNFIEFFNDIQAAMIKPLLEISGKTPLSIPAESPLSINNKLVSLDILQINEENRQSIVVILHDITGYKQAEEALKESEINYKSILEASPNAISIIKGFPPRHLFVNSAFTNLFGYTLNDVENGFSPFKMILEADRAEIEKLLYDRHTGKQVAPTYNQFDLAAKNGRIFPCEIIGTLIIYEGQTLDMVVFRDISELIRAEEEKVSLEAQLRQTHKMEAVGTLAGGIAHDFNNILGIIVGNTELSLADVPEWNPAHLNLKEVLKASLRARDVVRQLLSFSRKTELEKKPLKIAPIIKEISKLLRASIPSSIDIHYRIPDGTETIMADPTQIHQVVLNLCTNAADSMTETGGELEIKLEAIELDEAAVDQYEDLNPGSYARLSVRDTGQGISPAETTRIFDPYFTTKEVGKGTGLGLSVVHGIVKSHNGEIAVHSELGKGTMFEVCFPMVEKEAEKPPVITDEIPRGDERILFVDDEEAMVELGKKGLKRLGYRVEATTSAQRAIELLRADPDGFDLVISDMTMPEMTGDRLAKEIMQTRPGMPVILCTGYSEHISEEKALGMGISAFVMKPILGKELAVTIRQVLEHAEEGIAPSIGNIFVVYDEEQMRFMIRQMLEDAGYAVVEAPDGKVALWLSKEKPADLIITDIIMPEKEGLETIMELKRDFPDVKILAISGGGQGDNWQYLDMAIKMGAESTLAKPFENEELLKAVKDLLG